MRKYLLDTNIIINLWENDTEILEKMLKENKVVILNEVLNELAVKETRKYRRQEVLTERFCKLLPYAISIEKDKVSGFYMIFDYETKDNFQENNLSQNDLFQLYACCIHDDLRLVTEDKDLFNIGQYILGENKVLSLEELKIV